MEGTLGVTGLQRFLLRFVGLEPGVTRVRLATVLSLNAAEPQSDLEQLVARNLLIARSDQEGYFLTGHGVSINAAMKGTVEQAVSNAIDESTAYERTSLRRVIERVIRHLEPSASK